VVAEFPSVAEGLACALSVQRAIVKHSEDLPHERRLLFRIGIHVGDIIIKDGDLFGDAVNIAALAEPGGICVSATVREHVGNRVPASFIDGGAERVKNIAEPVDIFRVTAIGAGPPATPLLSALPDKPSVAVLPFANMSADLDQEFFADGIAEDIITALSRYPSLFVIARNSTFTYKGQAIDVRQVGRELGVRYVLEGSVRKSGNRLRVTAQLVDAEVGKHVWADRYDHDLADIFALQDQITEAVTIAIAPAIADAELQRAMRKAPRNLDAWGAYQHGLWHF
jgi:adenylate cyclase